MAGTTWEQPRLDGDGTDRFGSCHPRTPLQDRGNRLWACSTCGQTYWQKATEDEAERARKANKR